MTSTPHLDEFKEHLADKMEELVFSRVPFARELHTGQATDREYYQRHRIETVLRIRLNNEADSYCLYKIAAKEHKLAKQLAIYLAEELGHDELFLTDLKKLGVSREQVDATAPFAATRKLMAYLYHSIDKDGPMPTMTWNWFVEWYSDRYNRGITAKAAEAFGSHTVKGSLAHLAIDAQEDHVALMFGTVEQTIHNEQDVLRAKDYLSKFVALIADYFQELYEATLADKLQVVP